MLTNRIYLIIYTLIVFILFKLLIDSILGASIISFIFVMVTYISYFSYKTKRRQDLLLNKCDPNEFVKETEKLIKKCKDKRYLNYLFIDKAAGLIYKGDFEGGNIALNSVDESKLSERNGSLLTYTINKISLFYSLGEIEEANELFTNKISVLPPITKQLKRHIKILIAKKYFINKEYDKAQNLILFLMDKKLKKSVRLSLIYVLAEIDEIHGNTEEAKKKYLEVINNGNKLYIVSLAKDKSELLRG